DRRKNFYRNSGKPLSRIISIEYLGQCVTTIINKDSRLARSTPTTIIKKHYDKTFTDKITPDVYLLCAQATRKIEASLRRDIPGITEKERYHLKFHVVWSAVTLLMGKVDYGLDDLKRVDEAQVDDDLVDRAAKIVGKTSATYRNNDKSVEETSKDQHFAEALRSELEQALAVGVA
ncbi:MAG: hypothetical protein LUO79_03325, partial [Methanomassiliicoccales archaeon]|nr:hypothetical protein [Methanomassiliicoccales archaeon]